MRTIFPIIFIVIAIGAFIVFGSPLNSQVKKLKADIQEYQKALSNSSELEKTRDDLLAVYNKITNEEKDRLNAFLPNNANNIELVLEIQQIARDHDMPLSDIKFDPIGINESSSLPKNSEQNSTLANPALILPYGIFNLEFAVEGDYETFKAFLKDLEDNLRLINVKSITFSSPAGNQAEASGDFYKFNMKIETYWLKN